MKSEIKYNASREIKQLIAQWQSWLLNERRYSPHTLDAYSRDLSGFFDFAAEHLGKVPETADLAKLEVRDFRAYLSQRATRHIDKSSLARELSTLKTFSNGWPDMIFSGIRLYPSSERRGGQKFFRKLWK